MKLINRTSYMDTLTSLIGVPDIKVITGIRRSGKSKLLEALRDYVEFYAIPAMVVVKREEQAGDTATLRVVARFLFSHMLTALSTMACSSGVSLAAPFAESFSLWL